MNYRIDKVKPSEFPEVVEVWEASVRATHQFLKEEDIAYYRPLILNEYLHAVELRCVRDQENKIVAFLGVAAGNIEMLFIHPDMRGKGVGKILLHFAMETLGANNVDVNEANSQAVGVLRARRVQDHWPLCDRQYRKTLSNTSYGIGINQSNTTITIAP